MGILKSINWLQVRRTATRSLRLGDDKDSLDVKVMFTQSEAAAERIWKARMLTLLHRGPLLPLSFDSKWF